MIKCFNCGPYIGDYEVRFVFGNFLCTICEEIEWRKRAYRIQAIYDFQEFWIKLNANTTKRIEQTFMEHPFTPSANDLLHCRICKRIYKDHSDNAECESCGAKGKMFGVADKILLCGPNHKDCFGKHTNAMKATISEGKEITKNIAESIAAVNAQRQAGIKFSADFFNAKTIPLIEAKKTFLANDSIPANEREYEFHKYLVDYIESRQARIFNLDDEKKDLTAELYAAENILRDYGNSLREDIRKRLKESDESYNPLIPKEVKPKMPKVSPKNAFDRMVEQVATAQNISLDAARKIIEGGMTKTRMAEDK